MAIIFTEQGKDTLGRFPLILPGEPEPKKLSHNSVSYSSMGMIAGSAVPAPRGTGSNSEKRSSTEYPVSSKIIYVANFSFVRHPNELRHMHLFDAFQARNRAAILQRDESILDGSKQIAPE